MEMQYIYFKLHQCLEIKIYVLSLCCVQIKLYQMTTSTVFLFPSLGCPVPGIGRHYKQMLHEDVWSTFVHMGPSGNKKKMN